MIFKLGDNLMVLMAQNTTVLANPFCFTSFAIVKIRDLCVIPVMRITVYV